LRLPCASTANSTLRPSISITRALATTVRPIGVGATWRMLTSLPTETQPGGRRGAIAAPEATSIANIIIGVP
jgi:hypothetical protein